MSAAIATGAAPRCGSVPDTKERPARHRGNGPIASRSRVNPIPGN